MAVGTLNNKFNKDIFTYRDIYIPFRQWKTKSFLRQNPVIKELVMHLVLYIAIVFFSDQAQETIYGLNKFNKDK